MYAGDFTDLQLLNRLYSIRLTKVRQVSEAVWEVIWDYDLSVEASSASAVGLRLFMVAMDIKLSSFISAVLGLRRMNNTGACAKERMKELAAAKMACRAALALVFSSLLTLCPAICSKGAIPPPSAAVPPCTLLSSWSTWALRSRARRIRCPATTSAPASPLRKVANELQQFCCC